MLPREHGAYGQLLFPLLTALAISQPSTAALLIAAAAVALFVGHEAVLVLLGRRGAAARRGRAHEAVVWLTACGAIALLSGALALVFLPPVDWWTLAAPIAVGIAAAVMIAWGRERTTAGEIVVSAALASVSFPVAIAGSASVTVALTCALAYTAVFTAATVSVRAVIAAACPERAGVPHASRRACPERARVPDASRATAFGGALVVLGAIVMLARQQIILPAGPIAALPMCSVALVLVALLPPPRYLRRIGWTLVGATALTGIILVAAIR